MTAVRDAVALVTGSTSGIGQGIAQRLAEAGCRVALNSRTRPAEPVRLAGRAVPHLVGDVADESAVADVVAGVLDRYGRLDIVVNCAGATKNVPHHDLDGISVADWNRILGVNVVGAWNVVKAAAPHLRASPIGAVVNISSMAGIRVTGSSLPYSVSKAALNQLTRALAKALGPDIRVNAVAPGLIDTPWTRGWGDRQQEVLALAPLGRIGSPADVAGMVLALVEADYVTGEIVTVDGGLSLAN
ncbi:SDR family NAD(P)-dependent oxidoreductase [Plantactinospora sp. KBS50]|uniref:SDR family NAD(P)-dependent oxidoreductase n=1 Tax=Plantactinospora sp. KBS50 TaxID=2024580 RepID=UPI000BAB0529|nr:SDR family oxidoreductase [Plantactinospora sp. KBS50]ASW55492.1 polyketide synthase [Plantactinospora sp. KBS50]